MGTLSVFLRRLILDSARAVALLSSRCCAGCQVVYGCNPMSEPVLKPKFVMPARDCEDQQEV